MKRGNPVGETMSRCSFNLTDTFHTTAHTKVTEMNSSNNPRFRLLVGWCCLMTSGLLMVTVYILVRKSEAKTGNENSKSTENNTKSDHQIGSWYGPPFNDYIRLIRDKEKTWICNSCESSSFSLKNDTVEITTGGLYYIHAQVIFDGFIQKSLEKSSKTHARVILLKNKGPETKLRKLSEVIGFEPGTLTMIRLVKLEKGESISLDIKPESLRLSNEEYHTYWEILLYNK